MTHTTGPSPLGGAKKLLFKRTSPQARKARASNVPAKDRIEWPYVTLLIGIALMVTAAVHQLPVWVALVIFGGGFG